MNNSTAEKFLAEHYEAIGTSENDFRNRNLVEWVVSKVQGNRVLDIGAGSGFLLSRLHKQGKQVLGIEPNDQLIELAKGLYPQVSFIHSQAEALSKEHGTFSSVTIIDVLEHIEDDLAQLHRIREVLEPGGRLIIVVPAHPFLYGIRDEGQGHFRRYSKREILSKISEANMQVREVRFWNALGVLPYLISEKVLRKQLDVKMRNAGKKNFLQKVTLAFLQRWFESVENRISFGFGLSLMCICEKSR